MNTSIHHGNVMAAVVLAAAALISVPAPAAVLKVMKTGLGAGTVTSSLAGIDCGADCDETYGGTVTVTLTAAPAAGSSFSGWGGDCAGSATCTVTTDADRSLRAEFSPTAAIPVLADFTPEGVTAYLAANPAVDSPGRFLKALPDEYKQNWILMSRSESLQTGTATVPRLLLPSADARFVFTIGASTHGSYPGAHPNAIEYMQWDAADKNFRFHEIVLTDIGQMGNVPARSRGVSIDDAKCSKCHSTRNVLNSSSAPGTTGIPPGTIKAKGKPNWDAYDSWAGMLPFNRDRIYQGSVEAAAFRQIFNLWTWRSNDLMRSIVEQLQLQPPDRFLPDGSLDAANSIPRPHVISRSNGGRNDGHVNFAFDSAPPVLIEPPPSGSDPAITTNYGFDALPGTGTATPVQRGGAFLTLHHSRIPTSDEGRGVRLFDALGGLAGTLNQQRIADEVVSHHFATGSVSIDVRPIALAITKGCLSIDAAAGAVTSTPPLTIDLGFFNSRNGMSINQLLADTRSRAQTLPRRKADIEKINLDRSGDPYLFALDDGLIQHYGATTSALTDTSPARLRQEVFRRPIDRGYPDSTVMGGIFVDREVYDYNTQRVALYRYFLEPLGVAVDKWSMGVRGRSRTYTFADVFSTYANVVQPALEADLGPAAHPLPGLSAPFSCADLIPAVNATLGSLPAAAAVPTYTDIQRIFNKGCIECHAGLGYPPYYAGGSLDLSEDENPPATTPPLVSPRLARSYAQAVANTTTDPTTSYLYQRITDTGEACPGGVMPCGGPALSRTDVETIRRWIVGTPSRPSSAGDPHIKTVDGVDYDFQSAGEFVLLRDEGLEIQVRQQPVATETPLGPNSHTGLSSCVSINSAVAVRFGPHRIAYQPGTDRKSEDQGLQLFIDGKPTPLPAANGLNSERREDRTRGSAGGYATNLPSGGRIAATAAPGGIQIETPGGTVVVITPGWWDSYQVWYMNVDVHHPRATAGVMGAIAEGNWLPALPDGSRLGPRPADLHQRYRDLYETFADAWRVTSASSLFQYAPGTSTGNFTIGAWPGEAPQSCRLPPVAGEPPAMPPVKPLPLATAKQHCRGIQAADRRSNCEMDVMVTGETGFATTYRQTERIDSNRPPRTPTLASPKNNASDLASTVGFAWAASSDPDGDPVTYLHCVWEAGRAYTFNDCNPASSRPPDSAGGASPMALPVLAAGLLLVIGMVKSGKRKSLLLLLLVLLMLLALLLAFRAGQPGASGNTDLTRTVPGLKPGKSYLWKVLAEDGQGGTTDSETRRLTIR